MLATALLFDSLQFGTDIMHVIPIIGTIAQSVADILISVWAWLTFYLWFKIHGVSFMQPKRFALLNGGALLEMIPIVNSLPAWTLAVLLLIATTRAEELIKKIPGGSKIAAVVQRAGGGVRRQPATSVLKSTSEITGK
ncbi:MAG TPA: hypothetical protein DEF00_03025 [Candidatus Taylorbacteria bacterium]|nr:MAG: hypothetical protein UY03_C0003G0016 [Parcubacteria group bacterium GW2011_GWA2_47_64]KKU96803.1 MAG: hypothetical protein UY29_C0006G0012 [Parcubacteria group bacterium GW2011_GWC2_48_17]HBV01338.1 hypothetical protein [Candidatus Taylorbacteria bacterium]